MGFFRYFIMIFALLTLALPGVAYAVCAGPAGIAGEVRFDMADSAIEYCNGASWISLPRRPNTGCTSSTGNWSSVTIAANSWVGVAYGAGRFVAVSTNGTPRIMHSTNGVNWTAASPPTAQPWSDVIFANGQFVAIASTVGTLATSPDGITWTDRTAPEANQWNGLTYGNGIYVAVARNGTNRVMRSTDNGVTWTAHPAAQANQWFDVAYGAGKFVAVTTLGTNFVMTSPDGATWAVGTAPAKQWQSIAYGNGLFVAVAPDGPNNVMTSPDGNTWTTQNVAGAWTSVDFVDGMFVMVTSNATATNNVATSTTGLSWTTATLPQANSWTGVAAGNGTLVAIAGDGTSRLAVSNCASGQPSTWSNAEPQLYITNPTSNWWDSFGTGVSTDGVRIVVGVPGSDIDINAGGLAYVYDAASGTIQHTVHHPSPGDTDNFGWATAIDGNLFVVSAVYNDTGASDAGRVYVFNSLTGALVSTLVNPNPTADDNFGASVAISGNIVAVGTPYNDPGAIADAGSVYLFNATTGGLLATINNPAAGANDHFGNAVDISGGYVVIGAADDDPGAVADAGSVYVFNTAGTLVSTWANPLPSPNDKFGTAVAIDGNIAVAGAGVNSAIISYSFNATTGANLATFNNPDDPWGAYFGSAVDIDGDFAVISAYSSDEAGENSGAFYVYNAYTGAQVLRAINPEVTTEYEGMGYAISMKNGVIAAGATSDDIGQGDGNAGAFHTFSMRSTCANPAGLTGEMRYNADHRVVQWCDGTAWQAAGPVGPTGPTGGCSTPTATAGYVMFSSTSCTLQYCDGGTWQSMGSQPANPCSCNNGSWTLRSPASDVLWYRAAYGNGTFAAVGGAGAAQRVTTSPDGITWTSRNVPESNAWNDITFGGGLFVAVSANGTNRVMTSPDGITWTARVAAQANNWRAVTYGNGTYVAVAEDGTNRVMTSPDAITWTVRTITSRDWRDVAYGNGLFVAIANNTNQIATSPDGITWTDRTVPSSSLWRGITFGNGQFVAIAEGDTQTIIRSTDGINWTAANAPAASGWQDITYGNGMYVAVAVYGGPPNIIKSGDGANWTAVNAHPSISWEGVIFGNNTFVAVNGSGSNRAASAPCP